ncbi:hypothetical protein L6164_018582 [Bauhinia variegata]|uniref:Uncharacterized protein n=1 Tax=Bauhinia variegata TaxID=167791 RepID=A0ACB9NCW4_BAUVA|nr:hypothetical protein L6164_018582 [Bauhinia variegata]
MRTLSRLQLTPYINPRHPPFPVTTLSTFSISSILLAIPTLPSAMANKAFQVLGLFCLVLLLQRSAAYEFIVGGQKGWSVPSDPNFNPYNTWAAKSRFQIGDSIVFNYQSGQDSVLQVKSEDYANCNTDAPIAKFTDGHTVFKFNASGPHFFISGNKDNCLKNEKVVVIVLADRSNRSSNSNQTSTAPSPSPSESTSAPTPSPSGQEAPSPPASSPASPPAGTAESNPTPAPVTEPPPPNAASSILLGFAGSVGAFMASSLILTL